MNGPPLKLTYRIYDPEQREWVVTQPREWWSRASCTGDIWQTDVYMSTRTVEIDPSEFVPPREFR